MSALIRTTFKKRGLPSVEQPVFGGDDAADLIGDGAHRERADIGLDDAPRGVKALLAANVDGPLQLGELDLDPIGEQRDVLLLLGAVAGQLTQLVELSRCRHRAGEVGLQIAVVAGDQKAALSALGVLHRLVERVRGGDHLKAVGDHRLALPQRGDKADRLVGFEADKKKRGQQNQQQPAPQPVSRRADGSQPPPLAPAPWVRRFYGEIGFTRQIRH